MLRNQDGDDDNDLTVVGIFVRLFVVVVVSCITYDVFLLSCKFDQFFLPGICVSLEVARENGTKALSILIDNAWSMIQQLNRATHEHPPPYPSLSFGLKIAQEGYLSSTVRPDP